MLDYQNQEIKDYYSISVIIPNYNRKSLLIKSIKSVLVQTYLPKEILIVDDFSNYDVKEFIKKNFASEFENKFIRVLVNDKNCGGAISRNIGIKKSNYKFLAFLDSDDYWTKTKLEKQIKKFIHNKELDLVYCDQFLIRKGKTLKSGKRLIKFNILDNLINFWTAPNPSTLMFKKESLVNLGGFDAEVGRSCSDHYLWFKMALNNCKIDFVNEPLSYFVLDSSDRTSYNLKNRLNSAKILINKIRKHIPKKKHYRFKKNYIFKIVFPVFFKAIKEKKYLYGLKIFMKHLVLNNFFYKKILEKVSIS